MGLVPPNTLVTRCNKGNSDSRTHGGQEITPQSSGHQRPQNGLKTAVFSPPRFLDPFTRTLLTVMQTAVYA